MDIDIPPPTRRAFGRAWEDFEPVSEPERQLAEAARLGEWCKLGGDAPETGEAANTIRAEFLRFLALGGDARTPVHEKGVRLRGAFVAGELDLEGADPPFSLFLLGCRFAAPITLASARGRAINLDGSRLNGLVGDELRLDGYLHLRRVGVTGEARLLGARIAGNLECDQARFENTGGKALYCDNAEIGGSVFLRATFHATGETNFVSARITGNIECDQGRFENAGGKAIDCDRAEIGGNVFFAQNFTRSAKRICSARGSREISNAIMGGSKMPVARRSIATAPR